MKKMAQGVCSRKLNKLKVKGGNWHTVWMVVIIMMILLIYFLINIMEMHISVPFGVSEMKSIESTALSCVLNSSCMYVLLCMYIYVLYVCTLLCKCGHSDTRDPEIFLRVLTMPGHSLSQHSKTQQSHFTDFYNICL